MSNINWKSASTPPIEYGWYCVAKVPNNHSGVSGDDLDGDNVWRKNFGFGLCWFNNGKWFEANPTGHGTYNITERVTHWDFPPEVPILSEPFIPIQKELNLEYNIEVEKIMETMGVEVNSDTVKGFQCALKCFLRK